LGRRLNPFLLYGLPPDAFPARPWWKLQILDQRSYNAGMTNIIEWIRFNFERTYGNQIIEGQTLCQIYHTRNIQWNLFDYEIGEMDRKDDKEPVLRPPFLLGQVWIQMPESEILQSNLLTKQEPPSLPFNGHEWILVHGPRSPWASNEWRRKHESLLNESIKT
jgi:hypothetical protein